MACLCPIWLVFFCICILPPNHSLPPYYRWIFQIIASQPFRLKDQSFVPCFDEQSISLPLLLSSSWSVWSAPSLILWPTPPQEQDKYISRSPSSSNRHSLLPPLSSHSRRHCGFTPLSCRHCGLCRHRTPSMFQLVVRGKEDESRGEFHFLSHHFRGPPRVMKTIK